MDNSDQRTLNTDNSIAPRPAHAGGSSIPPAALRSLQPAHRQAKRRAKRVERKLRLENERTRQISPAAAAGIPPAQDALAP